MKNNQECLLSSEKGVTLIEILAALVILGIISVSFLTFFVHSSRTNNISETIVDATYVGQSKMEEVINNQNYLSSLEKEPCASDHASKCYFVTDQSYFIWFKEKTKDHNTHVIVRVYTDQTRNKLEAQMETILPNTLEE